MFALRRTMAKLKETSEEDECGDEDGDDEERQG